MSTDTHQQDFEIGFRHHQAGRLAEAERHYRQVLSVNPRHADTLHLLGVLGVQVGQCESGIQFIRQAIALVPDSSMFYGNLSFGLNALGKFDEAVAASRRALELDPRNAEAHNNLGVALDAQGRLPDAATAFRKAIELRNDYAEARNNLGNALRNLGHPADAVPEYGHALRINPSYADAHCNLGVAFNDLGRSDEAIASLRRAIQLAPGLAAAHYNLGNALRDRGDSGEAHDEYRRALSLKPDYAQARNNLANLLKDWGAVDEAIAEYRQIWGIDESTAARATRNDSRMTSSNLLLALHYRDGEDPGQIFREHRRWSESLEGRLSSQLRSHTNNPAPDRRLRVGYVSPDFRGHSVAYFLENLLRHHDPAQVDLYCYDASTRGDIITERFRQIVPNWRPIQRLTAAEVAEQIRADGIDILVDLAGHTANHRLDVFALKPAAVQATWLGYCGTSGMAEMDYRITDPIADPPGTTEHLHTEKLVRLPTCAWCFHPVIEAPPIAPLPAATAGHVTFGCFNALPKITPAHLQTWSEILRQVPGSRLLLKNPALAVPAAQSRLRALLDRAGISRDHAELFGNTLGYTDHLTSYGRVDIALDTFPYHGVTTTCEALWMGVPVVVLAGATHVSRVGVSLLENAGLGSFVASDRAEYVRIAVDLARDQPRIAAIRSTLRGQLAASPLMDAPRFACEMEAAYREMWRTWCATRTC